MKFLFGIGDAISGTPWWVWVLFAYIIVIGLKAKNARVVPLYKLLIVPLLFVSLTLHTLTEVPMTEVNILGFIAPTLLGLGLGFWQIWRLHLKVDKKRKLLHIPGSWVTLVLVLVIFSSKYYFEYTETINPLIVEQVSFVVAMLVISGLCTGIFIGRAVCYLYRFRTMMHEPLEKPSRIHNLRKRFKKSQLP